MGTLSKKLGQLAALSLESESSQILRTMKPNKIQNSLSQRLDTTLKDSHDMKAFGMGTLASMATKERYVRFTTSLYGVYSTMENELDKCCGHSSNPNPAGAEQNSIKYHNSPVAFFWKRHSEILRRAGLLRGDISALTELGSGYDHDESSHSQATLQYINAIKEAGAQDRADGSGRLLGHVYTRYLADLMGGQVLGTPTRLALRLDKGMPQQYSFSFPTDRKAYVESIYRDFNECGKIMNDENVLLEEVVEEARGAFRHNIEVYSEEPIITDSVLGLKNIVSGYMFHN